MPHGPGKRKGARQPTVHDRGNVALRRLSWDEYFIALADLVKERGSCPRIKVGAVIVDPENQIIATGYNGAPPGMPHCVDEGCIIVEGRCRRAAHAEENAIYQARARARRLEGCRIYTSTYPCDQCTRLAGQNGIREIIYLREYPNPLTPAIAEAFGITIRRLRSRVVIDVKEEPLPEPEPDERQAQAHAPAPNRET